MPWRSGWPMLGEREMLRRCRSWNNGTSIASLTFDIRLLSIILLLLLRNNLISSEEKFVDQFSLITFALMGESDS